MPKDLRGVIKEHRAFYEVLPYYVFFEEKHGSPTSKTRTIQAGFDVDIYGTSIDGEMASAGLDPDYMFGSAELQKIADGISLGANNSCSLELITFPSRSVLDSRNHTQSLGMLRIRISHRGGVDQPVGLLEEHALAEVESQLRSLGIARR